MKKLFLIISALIIVNLSFSQTEDYYTPASDSSYSFKLKDDKPDNDLLDGYSLSPGLNIGSSFSSFGNNPIFSSYLAPQLRVNTPGKLSMSFGSSFAYSSYPDMSSPESQDDSYFKKMASYSMFLSGSYQYSENLNIRAGGSVIFFPGQENNSVKRGHIGFDYKIGDNAWIQADFEFGDAYPFYRPGSPGMSPYSIGHNRGMPMHYQNSFSPYF